MLSGWGRFWTVKNVMSGGNCLRGLFFAFCLYSNSCQTKIIRTASVELLEERINGCLFAHEISEVDGMRTEKWTLAGKSVDAKTYHERKFAELLEENRKEQELQTKKQEQSFAFKQDIRQKIVKKLLAQAVRACEIILKKIEIYNLQAYLAFSSDTIKSESEFKTLETYTLPSVHELLIAPVDQFSLVKAQELLERLELLPHKLDQLFKASVHRAIDRCDDTQLLKKLLELVS